MKDVWPLWPTGFFGSSLFSEPLLVICSMVEVIIEEHSIHLDMVLPDLSVGRCVLHGVKIHMTLFDVDFEVIFIYISFDLQGHDIFSKVVRSGKHYGFVKQNFSFGLQVPILENPFSESCKGSTSTAEVGVYFNINVGFWRRECC